MGAIARARRQQEQLRSEGSLSHTAVDASDPVGSDSYLPHANLGAPQTRHHFEQVSVTPASRLLQRTPDDDKTPNPDPTTETVPQNTVASGDTAVPTGPTNDSQGSTVIQDPVISQQSFSGATLADVASALPTESGSVEFDFTVATQGDPSTSAVLKVTQTMTLPTWAERSKQCPEVQKAWDDFANALRTHEDGHVAIDKTQFDGAHRRFVGKASSATQTVSDQLRKDVQKVQDEFDTKTDHGRKGTPPTTIDLNAQCADGGKKTSDTTPGEGSEGAEVMAKSALTVGAPDDPYEREADQIADEIVRMETPAPASQMMSSLQRKQVQRCACGGKLEGDGKQPTSKDEEPMCAECQAKAGKVQRKSADEEGERPAAAPIVDEVLASGGQPLDRSVREFMEPRFGHDFSRVRVHTDDRASQSAQSVNALAYTVGRDVVFASGLYAPGSNDGRRLLAHELTHVVQQGGNTSPQPSVSPKIVSRFHRDFSKTNIQVQRDAGAGSVADAISNKDSSAVADAIPHKLGSATTEQKMQMIDVLLDKGGFLEQSKVPAIWESFGKNVEATANASPDRWKRSFDVAGGHMRASNLVTAQEKIFYLDVEDVAKGYLDQNEQYCKNELKRLGLSETGEIITGPPTQAQQAYLQATQGDAKKLTADQDSLHDLRNVMCGYQRTIVRPGSDGGTDVAPEYLDERVPFDPEHPPALGPKQGDGMKSHPEIKKAYEQLEALIQARVSSNPSLFPLIRGNVEDSTKTAKVAKGGREDALATLGSGLQNVLMNIGKTRSMLTTLASDLQPIQQQLLSGSVTSPTASSRNWKTNQFYGVMGHDITEQTKPGPWWQTLGLATAELAAYVVAGMATGGVAIGVGMAAQDLAQVAIDEGKSEALSSASQTNVSASTALISDGQVKEAEAAVIESAAFALLDTVLAGGEVRKALTEVVHFEREAAKAAEDASKLADKAMVNQSREEAEKVVNEAKQKAAEAKSSATKSRAAVASTSEGELARAEQEATRAEDEAKQAERSAGDADAAARETGPDSRPHAEPRRVGDHSVKARGNWVTRCSEEPCLQLIESVTERARTAVDRLKRTAELSTRADELGARFEASRQRAASLAERAENELKSTTDRLATETKVQNEGAQIEADVQALEEQVELELKGAAAGGYGKDWGEMVEKNIKDRIAVTMERATVAGKTPLDVVKKLTEFTETAKNLAEDAEQLEKPKHLRNKPINENDLALRWNNLDKGMEGVEREERVRADVRGEGGASLGDSDAETRKTLGIDDVGKKPAPSPDIAVDMGGGTLLLAESKGGEIDDALEQFKSALNSSSCKPDIAAGTPARFTKFDLRIYLKANVYSKLIEGADPHFSVLRNGTDLLLVGDLTKVGNLPVRIYPG